METVAQEDLDWNTIIKPSARRAKNEINYNDYVDLLPFENLDIDEYFIETLLYSSSDDWKEQFYAIDLARRLNKFESEFLETRVMQIYPFLNNCIHSPRTSLGKNALVFCQELYMQPRDEVLIEFTVNITPSIVLKTGNESKYLRNEAKIALQFLAASMPFSEIVSLLWRETETKNKHVKGFVWQALTIAIQNLELEYSHNILYKEKDNFSYPETLLNLFETLNKSLIVAKSVEGKEANKILKIVGKEQWKIICEFIFESDLKNKTERIMQVFEVKKKKKIGRTKFKAFGKGKKQSDFMIVMN